jgi:glycosyltransferase involved in cell wall biosynthesis
MQFEPPVGPPPDCKAGFSITVIIPVSGRSNQLRRCLSSLGEDVIPPDCEAWVADDGTGDDSIAEVVQEFQARLTGLRYLRRERRVGFIENCNLCIEGILPSGRDVLLVWPEAEFSKGSVAEMIAVLNAHERHAVVSPRSNDAGVFSIPPAGGQEPADAFRLWSEIKGRLPRFQVMPTCAGFCMLIRNTALRMFGLFDSIYRTGLGTGPDFVCRINRLGYSAIAANRAFVFHHAETSDDRHSTAALHDEAILDSRYPELRRAVSQHLRHYIQPVEHFSGGLLRRRQSILFDLSHLPARYCGTSEFALNLLLELSPLLERKYDVQLLLATEGAVFFGPELAGYQVLNEDRLKDGAEFDLVYKPAQVFLWREWYNLVRCAARLAYSHLDVIGIRCDYLCGPNTRDLIRTTAELVDLGITISEFSKRDFELLYGIDSRFKVIHPGAPEGRSVPGGGNYILVMGNRYPHKALDRAVDALCGVGEIVALGGDDDAARVAPGVRWIPSGLLSRRELTRLYAESRVVVCPSVYEGFGLPVLEALTHGKPVVALDLEVNRELASIVQLPDFHLAPDFHGIRQVVETLLLREPGPSVTPRIRSWRETAAEYAEAFEGLLARDIDFDLVHRRWKLMQTMDAYHAFV